MTNKCLRCSSTKALVPCRRMMKGNAFPTSKSQEVKSTTIEHYCEECIDNWILYTQNNHQGLLGMTHNFEERGSRNIYTFGCDGKLLVFLSSELSKEQEEKVNRLKNLKDRITYAFAKGYNIPFDAPYTKRYHDSLHYTTHTDKYGDDKSVTETLTRHRETSKIGNRIRRRQEK